MTIIVRPEIEVENPFGAIFSYISEDVLPLVITLETNKDKIQKLSDTELNDYFEIIKQYSPDLLTSDGKIDWAKVEEYASSEDKTKQKLASFLLSARNLRKDFAEASLYEKLQMIDAVGKATSPEQFKKIAVVSQGLRKVLDVIEKSNAPDDLKLWFVLNHEAFYEKPELLEAVLKIFNKDTPKESSEPAWSLSEKPETFEEKVSNYLQPPDLKLTVPAVRPSVKVGAGVQPQKKTAPKSVSKEQNQAQQNKTPTQPVPPPPKEVGLQQPLLDPIDLLFWGTGAGAIGYGVAKFGPKLLRKLKGIASVFRRGKKAKTPTPEAPPPSTPPPSTPPPSPEPSKYDKRREELYKRIQKEIADFKKAQAMAEKEMNKRMEELSRYKALPSPPPDVARMWKKYEEILKRRQAEAEKEVERINKVRKWLAEPQKLPPGLPPPSPLTKKYEEFLKRTQAEAEERLRAANKEREGLDWIFEMLRRVDDLGQQKTPQELLIKQKIEEAKKAAEKMDEELSVLREALKKINEKRQTPLSPVELTMLKKYEKAVRKRIEELEPAVKEINKEIERMQKLITPTQKTVPPPPKEKPEVVQDLLSNVPPPKEQPPPDLPLPKETKTKSTKKKKDKKK